MKSDNYITIQGWMVKDLGLKNTEAMAYALIYGFSQSGQGKFTGSLKYLQEWLGVSKNTASRVLKSLEEKGHILKHIQVVNGVTFNHYTAVERQVKNGTPPPKIEPGGGAKIEPGGGAKIDPYNISSKKKEKENIGCCNNDPFFDSFLDLQKTPQEIIERIGEEAIEHGLPEDDIGDFLERMNGRHFAIRPKSKINGLESMVKTYRQCFTTS